MTRKKTKILLDADVVIHFYKGDKLLLLPRIYKHELCMHEIVLTELSKYHKTKVIYENLIKYRIVKELKFVDGRMINEFAKLSKKFGKGESACMAYCKYSDDILASSNVKDIKDYCEENEIQYLTTLDFLEEAYNKVMLDIADCDFFIYNVISKGSHLKFRKLQDYIDSKKESN